MIELPQFEQLPDPYPILNKFRNAGPIHRVRLPTGLEGWLVTRYADVRDGLSDLRLSVDGRHAGDPFGDYEGDGAPAEMNMLSVDPPAHARLRKAVARDFTPRRVEKLAQHIEHVVDGLLDEIAGDDTADLVASLAVPLPTTIICELLGVPYEDRHDFGGWTAAGSDPTSDEQTLQESWLKLSTYLSDLIREKRRQPGDDLLTALCGPGELTDEELTVTGILLLGAGYETTLSLIGSGILLLLEHPDQATRLRDDESLLRKAVEEILRYEGPVVAGPVRFTKEDVEIAGVTIAAGQVVFLSAGSANRDPEVYSRPDVFDIAREDDATPLSFGHGIHFCLGAHLARLEARIAFGRLLRRFPRLRLELERPDVSWRPSVFRGPAALPVRLRA